MEIGIIHYLNKKIIFWNIKQASLYNFIEKEITLSCDHLIIKKQ